MSARSFPLSVIGAMAIALAATPALAREQGATAKLVAPAPEKVRVVADHAVWTCLGVSCVARLNDRATIKGCKDLAQKVGALASYGPDAKPLAADDLALCNAAAK